MALRNDELINNEMKIFQSKSQNMERRRGFPLRSPRLLTCKRVRSSTPLLTAGYGALPKPPCDECNQSYRRADYRLPPNEEAEETAK